MGQPYLKPVPDPENAPPLSPKDRLGWLASRGHLTVDQRAAGDKLMLVRERKLRTAYASFGSGAGGGAGNLNPLEARHQAERQYDRAMTAVTPIGEALILAVVIDGMKLEDAARTVGVHPKAVLPMLRMTLEVLAQHYARG